jgi:hypothetical protein
VARGKAGSILIVRSRDCPFELERAAPPDFQANPFKAEVFQTVMPDEQRVANNSQTYVANADDFVFEALEQENGQATVIRFKMEDPRFHAGDVLLVLSGSDIHFHGMIGQIADGMAIASDHRGSLLPATVQ